MGYTLSEEEIESYTSVEIFPNPSANIFNIEIEGFGKRVNIVVLDATGRQVSNESITSNDYLIKTQINLEGMESGIYFVKIGNEEKHQIKKLIKK